MLSNKSSNMEKSTSEEVKLVPQTIHTVEIEPLAYPERMKIVTLKKPHIVVQSLDTGDNNPRVKLVFQAGENQRVFWVPYQVLMHFCTSVEAAMNNEWLEVRADTKLELIIALDSLLGVPEVMSYLGKFKSLVNTKGHIENYEHVYINPINTYNQILKVAQAMGITHLEDNMRYKLAAMQYKKGRLSWFIAINDWKAVLENNVEGYWLRKELATSFSRAVTAGALENSKELADFTKENHPKVYQVIVDHIAATRAARAAYEQAQQNGGVSN